MDLRERVHYWEVRLPEINILAEFKTQTLLGGGLESKQECVGKASITSGLFTGESAIITGMK